MIGKRKEKGADFNKGARQNREREERANRERTGDSSVKDITRAYICWFAQCSQVMSPCFYLFFARLAAHSINMSSDDDNDASPAQCEGNHSPACPNRFFCTCMRNESTEDDAMAVLLEQEREGVFDVNAVGGYGRETA